MGRYHRAIHIRPDRRGDGQAFPCPGKGGSRLTTIEPNEPIDSVLRRLDLIRGGQIRNGLSSSLAETRRSFPNSNIRIGRFRRADIIIGDHEIRGNLFSQFDEAERIIKSYIGVRYDISEKAMQESFQRKEVWDYPLPAIREALLKRPHPPRLLQQHKSRPRSGSSTPYSLPQRPPPRRHHPRDNPEGTTPITAIKDCRVLLPGGLVER